MGEEKSLKHKKNTGKIVVENGEYFLEIGTGSEVHKEAVGVSGPKKFPLGPIVESTIPQEAIGKNAELIMSTDQRSSLVGVKIPDLAGRCYFILCYVPVDIFNRADFGKIIPIVDTNVRTAVAKKLLDEKVITAENYERMVNL